jgi:hypothetical protein
MSDDNDGVDGVDIDSGVLEPEDSLDDRGVDDVLDEGYSPPDRPWAISDWGLTAREAADHEPLDRRLARELPEATADDSDGLGDTVGTDGELYDNQVGVARSGRLLEGDDPAADYRYLYATDVGIDGGAASAEEAAIHVVPDGDDEN